MAFEKTKTTYTGFVAVLTALVGLAFYLYTSTSGYLAGRTLKMLPVFCTVLAIVFTLAIVLFRAKLSPVLADLLVLAATVLLIVGFALFAMDRVSLVADVYFIPVNYPQEEARALHQSLAGMGFYLVSIVAMILLSFSSRLSRD